MQLPGAFFSPSSKKNTPRENFLYSGKMELSSSNIKKFLTFSQEQDFLMFWKTKNPKNFLYFLKRKLFLYFRKRKPRKNFLYLRKRKLFYISGNGNPEKISYISGNGTFLYFRRNLQSPKNHNFLYFSKKVMNKCF